MQITLERVEVKGQLSNSCTGCVFEKARRPCTFAESGGLLDCVEEEKYYIWKEKEFETKTGEDIK